MTRLLGLDVGTTATKAMVIDDEHAIVAQASRPSDIDSPRPGWAEADPAQWWANVCSLTAELPVGDVEAVGVSGMVPCFIALDGTGRLLRPSIQQNDARAVAEVAELADELAQTAVLERTGSPVSQQSLGPTARWLARHEPETWAQTRTILGSYDFVVHRLTGELAVERNWALESGLLDLATGDWAPDLLRAAGIDGERLPPVRAADEVVGEVSADAAQQSGLPRGIPVVAGSADHVASAFAAGIVTPSDMLVKLGGAGDILLCTDAPLADGRLYLDFHLVPGRYLLNGCMAASGSMIRWFNRELAAGESLAALDERAAAIAPGSEGVLALPYMLGEKTPIHDPQARGAFVGLHLGHTRAHLFRAMLEAIAFGFRHHVDVFREHGLEPRHVRVTNGGASSRLWKQVIADVTGFALEVPRTTGGSALGAGFAAGMGIGAFAGWGDVEGFVELVDTIVPDATAREEYAEAYARYRALYPALRPIVT